MHENLTITDGVYGILSEKDVRQQVAKLGVRINSIQADDVDELKSLIELLLAKLEKR